MATRDCERREGRGGCWGLGKNPDRWIGAGDIRGANGTGGPKNEVVRFLEALRGPARRRKRYDSGMPFRSAKQRRFMYAKHPKVARRWSRKYGSKPRPKKRKG